MTTFSVIDLVRFEVHFEAYLRSIFPPQNGLLRAGSLFGGAVEEFLETNESVVYLDLSYNRIGTNRAAGEMLAKGACVRFVLCLNCWG